MMASLIQSGRGRLAYGICLVVVIVGIIAAAMLKTVPDAMAADRDYANKKSAA